MNDELAAPHDLGAERHVLGSMLLSKETAVEMSARLAPADFYRPAHATLFETMAEMVDAGIPVDADSVASTLLDTGRIGRVGGGPYLAELVDAVPVVAQAGHHAGRVLEMSDRRTLMEELGRALQAASKPGRPSGEILDATVQRLTAIGGRAADSGPVRWGELTTPGLAAIEAASKGGDGPGVTTGIRDLDRLLGGLRPGQLVTIAGRPGSGKTILVSDLARHAAIRKNTPVAMFSLEMSATELWMRLVAAGTGIDLGRITKGTLSDTAWIKIANWVGETSDAPLFVDDTPGVTLADIRSRAHRLQQRHGLGLVIVDYLQLITTPRSENRQVAVAELSRGLKLLAKELGVPVVIAAQLNRMSEQRGDKRPQISELRESGAVEQDSDVVILVHREELHTPDTPRMGEADLIVGKNRSGPTGTVAVAAQLSTSRFVDMAREEEPS